MLNSADTTRFINDANIVFSSLADNPKYYLELVFGRNDYTPEPIYLKEKYLDPMSFWYDQSNYFMVRINSIIRLFSFGYYKVHFVFFAFISFIATYNIFRFFEKETDLDDWVIYTCLVFFPGTLFWTAGAHKDTLVFLFIGFTLNSLAEIRLGRCRKIHHVLFYTSLVMVGLIRVYILGLLLPGAMALYWTSRKKIKPIYAFAICYGILIIGTVAYDVTTDGYRIAEEITVRQNFFINSDGNTSFELENISNSWTNIFVTIPQVIINPFIRPLLTDCNNLICKIGSIESIFLTVITILLLLKFNFRRFMNNNIAIFSILFSGGVFIVLGIIVNNGGALIRYRSIAIPFLLLGLILSAGKNKLQTKN